MQPSNSALTDLAVGVAIPAVGLALWFATRWYWHPLLTALQLCARVCRCVLPTCES